MNPRAIAIQHVAFEGLGILETMLISRGYDVTVFDACRDTLDAPVIAGAELLVVLGGPIGAYEDDNYPFLKDELRILEKRLGMQLPTLGVCLGAQLMARALGARVYPGPRKEIGWAPVALTQAGERSALSVLTPDVPVLHWHGDTFDLPANARRLASTDTTPNQAFEVGSHALGLQFHAESDGGNIEHWLVGHAAELGAAGVDVGALRATSASEGPKAARAGTALFARWLERIG